MKGCVAVRKSLHIKKRLESCWEGKNWTSEQSVKMLFSDVSIFKLIPGRRTVVRRRVRERYHPDCIVPTAKNRREKIQVWGCKVASGVGSLMVVNG